MTSSPHGPYRWGYTRHTMAGTEGCQPARGANPKKASRSPDRSLQLDCVKSESLVIADQNVAVNTFLVLYTPPVTPWEQMPEVGSLTERGRFTTAGFVTGVKS